MVPATGAVGRVAKEVLGLVLSVTGRREALGVPVQHSGYRYNYRTVYLKTLEVENIVDL